MVTEEETLDKMRAKLKYGNYNAPAAVIVCANLAIAQNDSATRYWQQDCSAATENLMIAAAGMELGTCWIGCYPKDEVMGLLRDILGIPEDVTPLNVIYMGYPAEEKEPRTQYDEGRVHWEQYTN